MTKENVLFSIIGVLLGFIVGFFFANSVNQRAAAPRVAEASAANQSELPPGHPDLPVNTVKDQQTLLPAAEDAGRKARDASEDFDAQMKAAELYYKANRFEDATEFLLRANQLRPDNYDVVVALGNINYDTGQYENAEKWYTAALVKRPDDINVRTDLGLTFFLREPPQIERAITEFRRSLGRDPLHEQTLQNLVVALTRKGDTTEARSMLERLEKVNAGNPKLPKLREELERARGGNSSGNSNNSAAPAGR
ncbi:MAG TPA: tetratricopeptide repeat protein [Pyrinomonadaceae bacterium]|jgi:tetratricopeptide (TPR) repeat protein|nr:tetratricopeptide repeat protein [Pyrinomonadaceae bacterium]